MGATGHIKPRDARLGGKLRPVEAHRVESSRHPRKLPALRHEFADDAAQLLRTGGSEKRRQLLARQRFRGESEGRGSRSVGPLYTELIIQFEDGIHGAFEQPGESFFTVANRGLRVKAVELRCRSLRKNPKYKLDLRHQTRRFCF